MLLTPPTQTKMDRWNKNGSMEQKWTNGTKRGAWDGCGYSFLGAVMRALLCPIIMILILIIIVINMLRLLLCPLISLHMARTITRWFERFRERCHVVGEHTPDSISLYPIGHKHTFIFLLPFNEDTLSFKRTLVTHQQT